MMEVIYCCYNSNLMKNLAYIPSKTDKIKIYNQVQAREPLQQDHKPATNIPASTEPGEHKKLSKEQMDMLIQRLTKNTKKQYNTQQQRTHILAVNLQLKKRREEGQKVQNRLLAYGKKLSQKKIELGKELQVEIKQKYYRDIPQITDKARNLNQKPIERRLQEIIEKKTHKRQELIEKYQPAFQPEINPQSEFINDLQNYGDFHNRMEVRGKQATKRRQSLTKNLESKKKQQYTFHPQINSQSKIIAEKIPRRPLSVTTPKTKQSHQTQINRQIYPFAPTINMNTQKLLNKKGSIMQGDCFRRLYNNAKDMVNKHEEKVQQRNRAHTFQPQLNNYSLRLAASIIKKTKQQAIQPSIKTQEEYQQIKIGTGKDVSTRNKCYSVRNPNQHHPSTQINIMNKKAMVSLNWLS